jgi:hypothetical protein
MYARNRDETVFALNPDASLKDWLFRQLIATSKITKHTEDALITDKFATPLFGQAREVIARVVPEAEAMSGYVNFGMANLTMATLRTYKGKFRYRTSNTGAIRQFSETHPQYPNHIYASGLPSGVLRLVNPHPLQNVPITSLVFAFDKESRDWSVAITQKATSPRKPRPASVTY